MVCMMAACGAKRSCTVKTINPARQRQLENGETGFQAALCFVYPPRLIFPHFPPAKLRFRLPRYPFRACSILLPSACLPEPAVHAVLGEQFAVRAAFGNLSAGEHDDLLRAADGGKAVGDDDNGFVLHQRVDGLLHGDFAFGVERGGGFVQDDDGRVFQQGAGDADALFFAAGEFAADVAHAGLVAFGHRHDEVVAAGGAGGGFDFCVCGVCLAEADIVGDGVVKQVNVLEDDGNLPHQVFLGEGADVAAADEDAPLLRVGVAHDEADEGGFAAAAVPDQRGEGAFGDVQADAAQDGFGVGVVVVMHVFKCDAVPLGGGRFADVGQRGDGHVFAQAFVALLHHAVNGADGEDLPDRLGKAHAGGHQRGEQPAVQAAARYPHHARQQRQQHNQFHRRAEQRVGQGFGEQGFALDGFHLAHRLLQARQAAAGAVGGFEHGQPLAVFQQFRVQARVCAGQTGAGAFGEGLRTLLDGHNQGKAEQQRQPEPPVPQHRQQRGGQRRADGGNQHIADNQGVVVGFVYRARKQRVQLAARICSGMRRRCSPILRRAASPARAQ